MGGVLASLNARRSIPGSCSGWVTSPLHLINWRTISTKSERPSVNLRMSLLPAVSTRGTPPSIAWCSRLTPLARPVSMCRLTKEGRPVAQL